MYYGIDISHWQGTVNFAKVKASGVGFVIAKCSQMVAKDKAFETYYADATKNGIPFGAYIYNKAINVGEAKKEAEFCVNLLSGKTLECGVWLDMEDASLKGLGKDMLTKIIEAEAEIITKHGYKVGIYCNKSWYKSVLDSKELEKKYPFWIAGYPSVDNGSVKESLRPDYGIMWQYSSKGKVNGISGNVDMDEAKVDLPSYMSIVAPKTPEVVNPTPTPVKAPSCPYPKPTSTLYMGKVGMKKDEVKWLQYMLNEKGDYGLSIDGKIGNFTDSAIKNYQRNARLVVDGKVGTKTITSLTS